MKYRVVIQPGAEAEVADAFAYIHARSPANAERWLRALYALIETLETMPGRCGLGRESAAFEQEIRQLLYGKRHHKYRVLFTVHNDEVHVLHVRHAARDAIRPDEAENEAGGQGLIGIVASAFRSPRITFEPSPVRRRYQSVGRPSKVSKCACMGGVFVTLKIAVPSSTSSNMAT